jgi:hypothetical protein
MGNDDEDTSWQRGQRVVTQAPDYVVPQGTEGTVVMVYLENDSLAVRFRTYEPHVIVGMEDVARTP